MERIGTPRLRNPGAWYDWDELVQEDRVHQLLYTDPAIFDAEMRNIFGGTWVYLAHESQIPEVDDYITAKLGLRPLARIHTATVVGSDPLYMLTGVIPATEKVLQRAGLTLGDIDLFEVNEAFAPVVLAWAQDTGADLAKTNVNGGAIAIGHPLGASGARIMTTLVNALEQRGGRYGLQTMCEGGGMANATIIERL